MLLNWLTMALLAAAPQPEPVMVYAADCAAPMYVLCSDEGAAPLTLQAPNVFLTTQDEDRPGIWIGVRLTPVPAPLAAQLDDHGAMVANVAKGSPADKAGVEQYDVIVRFGSKDIREPGDLIAALRDLKAGQPEKVVLIRKAAHQTIEITPVTPPKDQKMEMKYTEPEESVVDSGVRARGRVFEVGPDGKWIIKELGPMPHLPEALNEAMKGLDEKLGHANESLRDLDVRILKRLGPADGGEDEGKVEVRGKVEKDGQTTVVERDADGKIHVTHTAAAGKETSAVYDDEEALDKADPEAAALFHEHAADGGVGVIRVRPFGPEARDLRQHFQVDVEKRVKEALEKSREAVEQAREKAREAGEKAREEGRRATDAAREQYGQQQRIEIRRHTGEKEVAPPPQIGTEKSGGKVGAEKPSWTVRITDQGTIRVTVTDQSGKRVSDFRTKEEFKAAEPEIYEQARALFE